MVYCLVHFLFLKGLGLSIVLITKGLYLGADLTPVPRLSKRFKFSDSCLENAFLYATCMPF